MRKFFIYRRSQRGNGVKDWLRSAVERWQSASMVDLFSSWLGSAAMRFLRRPFFVMNDIEENARRKGAGKRNPSLSDRDRGRAADRCSVRDRNTPSMAGAPRSAFEIYLTHVVGDGERARLRKSFSPAVTSLLEPHPHMAHAQAFPAIHRVGPRGHRQQDRHPKARRSRLDRGDAPFDLSDETPGLGFVARIRPDSVISTNISRQAWT